MSGKALQSFGVVGGDVNERQQSSNAKARLLPPKLTHVFLKFKTLIFIPALRTGFTL